MAEGGIGLDAIMCDLCEKEPAQFFVERAMETCVTNARKTINERKCLYAMMLSK